MNQRQFHFARVIHFDWKPEGITYSPRAILSQIGQCSLDAPTPIPVLFRHSKHRSLGLSGSARSPRLLLPLYFCAISFRCQANKVSGVTMVRPQQASSVLTFGHSG
jgi:hypothetical protein